MNDPSPSDPPSASPRAASAGENILFPASFGTPERFFAALSQSIGSLTAYVDTDERLGYVCSHNAAWLGRAPEQLVGKTLLEVYGAQAYAEFSPWVRRALRGEPVHYERRAIKPDGTAFWISVNLRPHRDASGKVTGVFSAALEVQDLKRTHDALDQALHELAFHMENSPLAMIEWSGDITVKRWSRQAEAIFGWREDEVIGKKPVELGLVHADSLESIQDVTRELTDGRARRNRMLTRNVTKDGRVIYCEWYNSAFTNADGMTTSILSLAQDVTLRIEAEEQMRDVAVNDALTGLPNRLSFTARLEHTVMRARRSGEPLALLFVDLDKFKQVNDTHGHATGDELLRQAALRIKECVREADSVARLGGDEFVVLLETDVRPETPEFIAQRIRNAFAQGFSLHALKLSSRASIGVSRYPDDAQDAERLLAIADKAMYRVKHGQ